MAVCPRKAVPKGEPSFGGEVPDTEKEPRLASSASWASSPYVLKMRMVDEDTVAVTKLTLFARRYEDVFAVSSMREAETTRPLVTWESNGKLHYVEMGRVPKYLYDRLELERFDAQAQAEKYAKENEDKEDEDDDY